jgi:hypothetical protein
MEGVGRVNGRCWEGEWKGVGRVNGRVLGDVRCRTE